MKIVFLLFSAAFAFDPSQYPAKSSSGTPVKVNPTFSQLFSALIPVNNNAPSSQVYTKCLSSKDWALTYDDGPSQFTPLVLGNLTQRGMKGTFFVVGSQVLEYPDVVKSVVAAGMEIGIHSWSHTSFTTLTNEQIISEVMWTYKLVQDITGINSKSFRFPFGSYDNKALNVVQGMGFNVIQWDQDTFDWKANSSNVVGAAFKKFTTTGGHITLEHDLQLIEALNAPAGQDAVKNAGYNAVALSGCLGIPSYGVIGKILASTNTTTTSTTSTASTTATSTDTATSSTSSTSTSTSSTTTSSNNSFQDRPTIALFITCAILSILL